jgi:hypothetical protein
MTTFDRRWKAERNAMRCQPSRNRRVGRELDPVAALPGHGAIEALIVNAWRSETSPDTETSLSTVIATGWEPLNVKGKL